MSRVGARVAEQVAVASSAIENPQNCDEVLPLMRRADSRRRDQMQAPRGALSIPPVFKVHDRCTTAYITTETTRPVYRLKLLNLK